MMVRRILLTLLLWTVLTPAYAFDPSYAAWTHLLQAHVQVINGGNATRVDYAGLRRAFSKE